MTRSTREGWSNEVTIRHGEGDEESWSVAEGTEEGSSFPPRLANR